MRSALAVPLLLTACGNYPASNLDPNGTAAGATVDVGEVRFEIATAAVFEVPGVTIGLLTDREGGCDEVRGLFGLDESEIGDLQYVIFTAFASPPFTCSVAPGADTVCEEVEVGRLVNGDGGGVSPLSGELEVSAEGESVRVRLTAEFPGEDAPELLGCFGGSQLPECECRRADGTTFTCVDSLDDGPNCCLDGVRLDTVELNVLAERCGPPPFEPGAD